MTRDTGTSEGDLLLEQLVAAFLASFVSLPIRLSLLYAYGADTVFARTYVKKMPAGVTMAREVDGVVAAEGVLDATGLGHFAAALVVVGGL